MAVVPPLATTGLPTTGAKGSGRAPPTPHANTGRRLSKSIMRADSQDEASSKGWGMLTLRDGTGTNRAVRVVQNEEYEGSNMVKIRWFWEWEGVTHQVELRHGRRSGIRKVYVDKQLLEREKSFKNMLSDTGSQHEFVVGNKRGEILIVPKGTSGFLYQLKIDGQAIEQNLVRRPAPRTPAAAPLPRATVSVRAQRVRLSAAPETPSAQPLSDLAPALGQVGPVNERPLDIGTRPIQLPKTADGLGMTLRNNPFKTGVVVWTVEEGKAAWNAGLRIGDVVLSVEEHLLDSIDKLVDYVSEAEEYVNMEVAGLGPSKQIALVKARDKPVGLGLQVTSCGVGILVTEIDQHGSAAQSGERRARHTRVRPPSLGTPSLRRPRARIQSPALSRAAVCTARSAEGG